MTDFRTEIKAPGPSGVAGHLKQVAQATVADASEQLLALSHRLHKFPEVAFEEERAVVWLSELLIERGFTVTTGVAGLKTAFIAEYGSDDGTVVGLCAEYDALPGIGHACGHNVIAGSALGAAFGLAAVADELGVRVKVLGTPAEEGGGGKITMIDAGLFADLDFVMMVHPTPREVVDPELLACAQLSVRFSGREAHAASYPENGINAADAMTVAQVALGLLRQHIRDDERIHGVPMPGSLSPNVIPAAAGGEYVVRARSRQRLEHLVSRLRHCFEAGALATGSHLEITEPAQRYLEMIHDRYLAEIYQRNAEALGRRFRPLEPGESTGYASTDFGNVSHVVPAIIPTLDVGSGGVGNHEPEFAAFCARSEADQALLDGAIAMAWTAIDVVLDPERAASLGA
jgi:amidohydrolase